jgi:hypothetical protein
MHTAERTFLRWHKKHFWILCHEISAKDLGYIYAKKYIKIIWIRKLIKLNIGYDIGV